MYICREPACLCLLAMTYLTTIGGISLLVISIVFRDGESQMLYSQWFWITVLSIIMSSIVVIFSVAHINTAAYHTTKRLKFYAFFIVLSTTLQAALIIAALVVRQQLGSDLDDSWSQEHANNPDHLRELEIRFQCCGFHNTTDRAIPKKLDMSHIRGSIPPSSSECSDTLGFARPCGPLFFRAYRDHQTPIIATLAVTEIMLVITLIAILNQFMRLPSEMDADQHLHREHASRLFTAVFGSKGSRDDRNDNHGDGTVAAVEISVGDAGQSGGRRRGRSSATANGEGSSRRNIDPATMISLAPGEDEEDDGQVDPYEDDDQGADDEAYDIDDEQRAMLRRNERTYGSTASC